MSTKNTTTDLINLNFESNRTRCGINKLLFKNKLTPTDNKDPENDPSLDKSRKGSVDSRIQELVQRINESSDFFTTSSCSGRILLFTHDSIENKKKGCNWLYMSHDEVLGKDLIKVWNELPQGMKTVLKVEPTILHIQSRSLSAAKKLIHLGTESGFRNSGMVIGRDNKMTVAIRSPIGMEVPLTKSELDSFFNHEFLESLVEEGNAKLRCSWDRMNKFHKDFLSNINQ